MAGDKPSLLSGPSAEPDTASFADQAPGAAPAAPEPSARPPTPPRPTRNDAPRFSVGGFWRRLAAAALDAGIVLPVAALLVWITSSIADVSLPSSRHRGVDFWLDLVLTSDPAMWGAIGLIAAIGVIYLFLFQLVLAQTPGMRVMNMRIIDVYGDPPSVGRVAARTAGYLAGFVTLCLGFLWVGFDSERRGLHDWIAGTYVVKS